MPFSRLHATLAIGSHHQPPLPSTTESLRHWRFIVVPTVTLVPLGDGAAQCARVLGSAVGGTMCVYERVQAGWRAGGVG